jgi:hypothetical protein
MLAFLLNFLEAWFGFTKSVKDFVNKFEDLLIFEFGIEEVKVMFGLTWKEIPMLLMEEGWNIYLD